MIFFLYLYVLLKQKSTLTIELSTNIITKKKKNFSPSTYLCVCVISFCNQLAIA